MQNEPIVDAEGAAAGTEAAAADSPARRFFPHSRREWFLGIALLVIGVVSIGSSVVWMATHPSALSTGPMASPAIASPISSFDLTTCLIPKDEIRAGGPAKDGIPAITAPKVLAAGDADYLDDADRVIGVVQGDQARAYPLRILNWHENVNDTLGGKPIAVTYCPLCDSAVVFDRSIDGETREFGISGLLYNSNVLLFDRHPDGAGESLWSQLQMRAVTGPAAKKALTLTVLPADLTSWSDWRRRHPHTTVLSARTGYGRNYGRNPYANYFRSQRLMFDVNPPPNPSLGLRNKDKLVIVRAGSQMRAFPVRRVAQAVGATGSIDQTIGPATFRLTYLKGPDTVRVEPIQAGGVEHGLAHTFWFAWSAMHPGAIVFAPTPEDAAASAPR